MSKTGRDEGGRVGAPNSPLKDTADLEAVKAYSPGQEISMVRIILSRNSSLQGFAQISFRPDMFSLSSHSFSKSDSTFKVHFQALLLQDASPH